MGRKYLADTCSKNVMSFNTKFMILHLVFDDKFADYAVTQFAEDVFSSEFVLIQCAPSTSFLQQREKVRRIVFPSSDFDFLLTSLGNYNAVILHGLFWPWQEKVLRRVPDNVKVGWVFWGGDIYGRSDIHSTFLAPKTKILLRYQNAKRWLRNRKCVCPYELPKELFSQIDYCLTDIPEDMQFVRDYLQNNTMKELWYNYYSIEETIGPPMSSVCNGNNILIDNSCSIEGNHLEAFSSVSRMPIEDRKIIVPLSYGESWLRRYLLHQGNRLFGDNFCPLTTFLPRNEYNKLIESCSVVVMNHYRPQAMGNIMTSLWLGARVYMSKKSLLYSFYKRIGCVLFSVEEDLKPSNNEALLPLSDEDRERNRSILHSRYGRDVMFQRNLELVAELDS